LDGKKKVKGWGEIAFQLCSWKGDGGPLSKRAYLPKKVNRYREKGTPCNDGIAYVSDLSSHTQRERDNSLHKRKGIRSLGKDIYDSLGTGCNSSSTKRTRDNGKRVKKKGGE